MSGEKNRRERHTLVYPRHAFEPEDLLRFVELKPFTSAWKDLGLRDEDQQALEVMIMMNPKGHPVVEGTGGLRKMRFAPARWETGKRGAARVCYVYFEEYCSAVLVLAYGKNEKDDLAPHEKR